MRLQFIPFFTPKIKSVEKDLPFTTKKGSVWNVSNTTFLGVNDKS